MSPTVKITLPPGSHEDYLAWMRYWRQVEAVMLDHPRLAELAAREAGAAFIREPVADYISHDLIPQIGAAAEHATPGSLVSPTVEVEADKVQDILAYAEQRMRWLEQPGVHEALGVRPLSPEILEFRARALVAIRDQITSFMVRRAM